MRCATTKSEGVADDNRVRFVPVIVTDSAPLTIVLYFDAAGQCVWSCCKPDRGTCEKSNAIGTCNALSLSSTEAQIQMDCGTHCAVALAVRPSTGIARAWSYTCGPR